MMPAQILVLLLAQASLPLTPIPAMHCELRIAESKAPKSIRNVDWCNHDFGWFQFAAGRYEQHLYRKLGTPHDTILRNLAGVAYGDLDGDGRDEAAVVVNQTTWIESAEGARSSSRVTIEVLSIRGGVVESLGSISDGPVRALALAGHVVLVDTGEGKPHRWRQTKNGFELEK